MTNNESNKRYSKEEKEIFKMMNEGGPVPEKEKNQYTHLEDTADPKHKKENHPYHQHDDDK